MGCESSDVVRFDLGPLLQCQMRVAKLKSVYNLLIIEKCCLSSKLCWPFLVDTSCIWPQMSPWSSFYLFIFCRHMVHIHKHTYIVNSYISITMGMLCTS